MPPAEADPSGDATDPGDSPGEHHEVAIAIDGAAWCGVADPAKACRDAALAALAAVGPAQPVELSILLTDDREVRALNQTYRGRDEPTNVLSFTAADRLDAVSPAFLTAAGRLLLGDVVVAFETVDAEARARGKTVRDHLCHLVVHGTLHTLGYDHQDATEAAAMEAIERRVLAALDVTDPYAWRDVGAGPGQ